VQDGEGDVELDSSEPINPRPHTLYYEEGKDKLYYEPTKRQTFFRLDNNEEQMSDLRLYKDQVDDYDIHASSLTNNLVDFDTPLHVVKGFQGDDLTQLQQNLKTKKIIGVDDNGGVEVHTVEIPYQARLAKLELDEKAIYRSGMGLNTAGLKDTNATTNMAIKSAYSLLDMKAKELEKRIKRFMRGVIRVVLDEINAEQDTDFQLKDVKVEFKHEIMTNELENAQIKQTEAQEQNMRLTSIMNVATVLDKETVQQQVCNILELDYEEIKGKLPDPEEAANAVKDAQGAIDSVVVEDEPPVDGIA
jgi:SPP1 family phage portal protein